MPSLLAHSRVPAAQAGAPQPSTATDIAGPVRKGHHRQVRSRRPSRGDSEREKRKMRSAGRVARKVLRRRRAGAGGAGRGRGPDGFTGSASGPHHSPRPPPALGPRADRPKNLRQEGPLPAQRQRPRRDLAQAVTLLGTTECYSR